MRGTIADDSGLQHRVSRIWVADDAGVMHEVVKAWVGDAQGNPKLWFDKNAVLSLAVVPTVLDAYRVKLTWTLQPQGEVAQEYHVYRDGVLRTITTLTTFTDTGLSPGTTYTWRIDVVQAGSLTVSGSATATTDTYIPPAVATLTATVAGYFQVNLAWTVSGHDSFVVKRGNLALATSGTSFADTGLNPGTQYTYTITALKTGATTTVVTKTATTPALPAATISASAGGWDRTTITWGNIGADVYQIYRNDATMIYNGPHTGSITDTGLWFNTGYYYTVYAYFGGLYSRGQSANVTTNNRSGMNFYATGELGQIHFGWDDQNGGAVDAYEVWLYSPNVYIIGRYGGPGTGDGYHTGLPENWTGYYELTAFRGGEVIHKEQAGARTYRLITSYAATSNGRANTSGGWCETSKYTPGGGTIGFPVGGTMVNIKIGVWGYSGSNARIRPYVGGVARQDSIVGPSSYSADGYNHLSTCGLNVGFGAGTHSVGMRVGGSEPAEGISSFGRAEWRTWTPYSDWRTQVFIDGVSYQWYTSQKSYEDLREHPWWDTNLEDPDLALHLETVSDGEGEIVKAKIVNKDTGETLVDWEREG